MQLQRTEYFNKPLWQVWERVPHPNLIAPLLAKDQLIILQHGNPPYHVVLGVPHQTATHAGPICEHRLNDQGEPWPRPGDDNTVSYALVAFSRLQQQNIPCKLVIVGHATQHDPNKHPETPYCQELFRESARLLWECHACGDRRHYDLELSAGKNRLSETAIYGRALAQALGYQYKLGVQTMPNSWAAHVFSVDGKETEGQLQLPAIKTYSLYEAENHNMAALHLEAKTFFREAPNDPNTVSRDGLILGRAIAETIINVLQA